LIAPFLRKRDLPNPDDYFSQENIELALLCLENEVFDEVYRNSIITQDAPISTGMEMFDKIEEALAKGEDFNELIKRL
jgi:hypothetical protein